MSDLIRGYGRALTAFFFAAAVAWGLILIILPQFAMLERAMTLPKRQLDSSVAGNLQRDSDTCATVLATYLEAPEDAPVSNGGMAFPSASGMSTQSNSGLAIPSASGMAVPSASGMASPTASGARPYILQCDRSTTRKRLVRDPDAPKEFLDETYGLPLIEVRDTDPIEVQIERAQEINALAATLFDDLRQREAEAFPYTLDNFSVMTAARLIPLSPEQRAIEDAKLSKQLYGLIGLRFEENGEVHERIGLIILVRTLTYAVAATALALLICYPIAYKVALATPPERAVWLFLGLVIPYAIVELMRIYAWTSILDNNGVLNGALAWIGAIGPDDPIQFKRFPGTVFVVIVYTYVLFMVFPIFNVMSTLDRNQVEAARDLGAAPWRVHWRVIIPHSKPGIAVGCIATFMLAAGAFSVPRIISSGLQAEWFSQTIYNKFFESENSNVGASYSFAYTLVCFVIVGVFMWAMRTRLKDFARVQ
ncbi:MAG: ABC transporter permease [Pseudomonadota bacterium]